MFDKKKAEDTKKWHDKHIEKTYGKLYVYNDDPYREKRKEKQLCKYCFYMTGDSWAGQAFSDTKCEYCEKEMTFATTDTDSFCIECARKLNVCKHCGQVMD